MVMTWLARLRDQTRASAASPESSGREARRPAGSDETPEDRQGQAPSVAPVGPVRTTEQGTLRIPYQRVWYDFDVRDGEYPPEQLQRARMVVKPWGPVRFYALAEPTR
jgi:hypothetical protein